MNWRTIGELSIFGLAMGIATVFVIPSNIEPSFWLVTFVVSAYVIARRCFDSHFVHGLFVGLANCVWVTGAHVLFFHQYMANHPQEAAMLLGRSRDTRSYLINPNGLGRQIPATRASASE